jgi:hypothetical protein
MSFTVSHVLLAAGPHPALISSETAAYLVLSLAEQSLTRPRRVCADHILLHPGGAVTIGDVPECHPDDNGALLRELLGRLLACASQTTISDTLAAIVQGRARGPAALRNELQTALVPLNRGAARRALNRLYRKLERAAAGAHSNVSPRVKDSQPEGVSTDGTDEILICIDEAGLHDVLDANDSSSMAALPQPASDDPPSLQWHPAQPTPRLFRDRSPQEHGTPILGSVAVQFRELASTEAEHSASMPDVSHGDAPLAEPHSESVNDAEVAPLEWSDTIVDAPVSPVADKQTPRAVVRRTVRRSAVSQLVERMPAGGGLDEARSGLLRMVNAAADAHEFSLPGTVTPPPVAQDTSSAPSSVPRRGPRRIALSAFVAVATAVCAWALLPHSDPTSQFAPSPAAPAPCRVQVHVEVPSEAKVYLNDAHERPLQRGPLARFEEVECDSHAEVTVQMPNPSGSPLPEAWMRMPLPEVDLRAAADQGVPFRVAPLGEAK